MELSQFPDRPAYDIGHRAMASERGPRGEDFARQILATVAQDLSKPVPELVVLDIGCGYGHTALALARQCSYVVGIEPCSEPAQSAIQLQQMHQVSNLEFHHATLQQFQTKRAFDLVILDNVLEHLPDQPGSLRHISELLAPGGVLYLLVPNRYWPMEVHYHLPFLGWLPLELANYYLKWTGKGTDYTDASYAPGFLKIIRLMNCIKCWRWRFSLPANLNWTTAGNVWHYRWGVQLLKHFPAMWALSKAFLIVAKKHPARSRRL
ncbi:MAG TPA: methyltransferase domain-containing protein [Gemmatales bacterium]|nr:methyltransferase domain-containing protein [Gemmatales bacterium]HMP15835.1 methyltransferase domain-containing protein [Gemmatales bacterium]